MISTIGVTNFLYFVWNIKIRQMIGGGFLQLMKWTMEYNRSLLGKGKHIPFDKRRRTYKELAEGERVDPLLLKQIVSKKLRRNKAEEAFVRVLILCLLVGLFAGCYWIYKNVNWKTTSSHSPRDPKQYFSSTYNDVGMGMVLKTDHYRQGPKAAETFMKNGMRHQQSYSYYQTGEQFRAALFYYDTLVTEVYLYKNGDTIRNFPVIQDLKIHHITIPRTSQHKAIRFDYYDGKIMPGSYLEETINE